MDKMQTIVNLLRGDRGRRLVLVFTAVGLLLLVLGGVISRGTTDTDGAATAETDPAREIEEICKSVEGVGECRVILSYSADGRTVTSVAVVCEGGDSITVRHRLTEMLSSFYGIGYHRISVEKMG